MGSPVDKTLFVWRAEISYQRSTLDQVQECDEPIPEFYWNGYPKRCPFCNSDVIGKNDVECPLCGFRRVYDSMDTYGEGSNYDYQMWRFSALREFPIASTEVALDELATHLRNNYSDIIHISPRRFEELVADIYRHLGYEVMLTKQTRDGGVDIILLENGIQKELIECKRYAQDRKICVGVARQLLGVQLLNGIKRATIVATTRFTDPCKKLAQELNAGTSGYTLSLEDAGGLLEKADCYNTSLPPLHLVPHLNRPI